MNNFKKFAVFIAGVYFIFALLLIYKLSEDIYILSEKVNEFSKVNMELRADVRASEIMQGNPNFINK